MIRRDEPILDDYGQYSAFRHLPFEPCGTRRIGAVEPLDVVSPPTRVAMPLPTPAGHHLAADPPSGQLAKQGVSALKSGNLVECLGYAAERPIRCAPAGNYILHRQEVGVPAWPVVEKQTTVVSPTGVNVSAQNINLGQRNQLGKRPQPNPPKLPADGLDNAKRTSTYGVGSFAKIGNGFEQRLHG